MSAAAQAVRPKSASETKRAPETRRATGELHAMANAAPRYLQAGVQLGGLHDPQEHEAEHAAGVIAAGGQYQVRDPGGSGHLRAAPVVDPGASGRIMRTPATQQPAAQPVVAHPVVDPGASGRIMRTPAAQQPAAQPVVAHPVIDPGASGQIRRAAAHAAEPSLAPAGGEAMRRTAAPDPGGARHPTVAHAPDPIRRAPADMPRVAPGLLDKQAGARIEQARSAASRPLPATVRARLEHGFGESMGSVRVQAGPEGQHAARSIAARAYTEGERITLGPGESEHDMRLMAHEATHVVQNRRAAGIRRLPAEHGPARPKAAEGEVRRTVQPEAQPAAQPVRRGILDSIVGAGLDSMLDKFADLANAIPGFRLFTIIIGKNPINGQQVDGSGANILRAAIELIPFGALVVQALDKYGVFEKAGAWIDQQVASVKSAGAGLRDALMQFVHTLDITEAIRHPGDVWENAKHIFTEPIEQLKGLFKAAYDSLVAFIKDAILKPLAARASKLAAWDLAIALIGTNPITGDEVPLNADTVVGGLMKLAGQDEIWQNVLKSGAKGRITSWFGGAKAALVGFVRQLPALFLSALKAFQVSDLLDLPGAFLRVAGMFGDFAGRFVSWALDAGWKLLEIVFDVVSPGAFAYIKKTGAALKSILKNPLPFVGNLVKAAKLGLSNFAGNFVDHLKAGLLDWLTGSLPGVYIPKALSLAELGKFALSVLGITWAQIRTKIVKALGPKGETIMQALELAFEVIKALRSGGPTAAWELIKDKLANLRDTVIDGIIGFVTDAVVKKAIPKLVAMFIPGAGFIAAIISIYGTVSAFVEKLSKIVAAVKAFVDSIVAIAQGQIAGAAARVESALAGVLSIAISLLAGFVGLGNVAEKVMGVVKKVQTAVDKGLDVAINWVVNKAKGLFAKLFGKKDDKKDGPDDEKTRKAIETVRQRVDGLLGKGMPRDQLKNQVQSWAGELGVRRVGMEEGQGTDSVFVENSPRFTTNKVISANVQNVYKMIYDIAIQRLAAKSAATPIKPARQEWQDPRGIAPQPGQSALVIATGLRAQGPETGIGTPIGRGVPIYGDQDVTAQRKAGVANYVVTKLGKYPEIAESLKEQGKSVGDLAKGMAEAERTGTGDPFMLRMVALMQGAEPARENLPAATAPLLLGSALQPDSSLYSAPPVHLFGKGPKGGLDPASPEGARATLQRAEETVVEGKEYGTGTDIAKRTDKHVKAVAQAVFEAVLHLDFKDPAGLRARVLELIDIYDKAAGVSK